MSNALAVQTNDFTTIVDTNFETASTPQSDVARKIAAEAAAQVANPGKKGGVAGRATGRSDMFRMNPYNVHFQPGLNSRNIDTPANAESIDTLARSIAANGVKMPLTVFLDNGKLCVSDGHRRLLATSRAIEVYGADIRSIPVINEPVGTTQADRVLLQVTTGNSQPLDIFEVAEALKKLVALGWTVQQISEKSGLSVAVVNQRLQLLSADDTTRAMVSDGRVSATLAWQTLKAVDGDAKLATKALGEALVTAKAKGKAKVTKADLTPEKPRASFKRTIRTILEGGRVGEGEDDGLVTVTFTKEDYDALMAALSS